MEDNKFLKKTDLQKYREQVVAHLAQIELDYHNFTQLLKYTDERIANFPEDAEALINEVMKDAGNSS